MEGDHFSSGVKSVNVFPQPSGTQKEEDEDLFLRPHPMSVSSVLNERLSPASRVVGERRD